MTGPGPALCVARHEMPVSDQRRATRGCDRAVTPVACRQMLVSDGADVVVVGLGAMGSAVCAQLAGRGAAVVGIDQYDPPHPYGSTHGETRMTRLAVGEGAEYVPLVRRSRQSLCERRTSGTYSAPSPTANRVILVSPCVDPYG